jgi:hypothetical protein
MSDLTPDTYRYPRTLAEAASRHLCNGEDAHAIEGPYKSHNPDAVVLYVCVICAALLAVMTIVGWLQ